MLRRCTALLLTLLASLVLLGATAPAASAHAALLSTTPGDSEILETSPEEVTLTFGEPVGIGLGNLKVVTVDGDRVDDGAARKTDGGKVVRIPLKDDLDEGTYVVVWRVISADAHPVSGAFTFSVGKPSADTNALLGKGNLTSIAPAPEAPGVALGVTRFVGFSALVLLLGGAVFCLLLWPAGTGRLRPLLLGAAAVEAVAAGAALLLQGPYASGNSLSKLFDTALLDEVLHSQYGVATAVRVVLSVVAAVAVLLLSRRTGRGPAVVLTVLAAGVAACWSAAGHAGVGTWQPFTFAFDLAHLLTVSAWVGGLVVLGLGLRGRWSVDEQRALLPGWSRLAFWSVVALVATGTFASLREVGEVSALTSTRYGVLLLVKIAVVALMLLFALIGRAYVREHYTRRTEESPATPSDDDVASLRRSTAIESALSVVVLVITAFLVNTTPAKAAFAPPYSGRSEAGPLTVQVDVYPARKGLNGLHVYTVGAGGRTVDVAEVTGFVVRSDGEKVTVDPRRKSLGHYEDLSFVLPAKGSWTIELQIRTSDIDSYPTKQTFEVK